MSSCKFSVIIPYKEANDYLVECLAKFLELDYNSFEIILLPDFELRLECYEEYTYPIQVIITGEVSPAIKRNLGAKAAQGEYFAFIDEDAYPKKNWLIEVEKTFVQNPNIAAVGGPQITPYDDPFLAQVSGAMYLSVLNGSAYLRYVESKKTFYTDDWPSVNLCVRREDFFKAGAFDSAFWPGEDTKFCLDLVTKTQKKIVYNGQAVVYHHRREGLKKHLRQVGGYGLHRGFFAKRFPQSSLRLSYLMPTCFALFVLLGWLALFMGNFFTQLYFILWVVYLTASVISFFSICKRVDSVKLAFIAQIYMLLTHFWYGIRFIQGFFSKNIYSRLSR